MEIVNHNTVVFPEIAAHSMTSISWLYWDISFKVKSTSHWLPQRKRHRMGQPGSGLGAVYTF